MLRLAIPVVLAELGWMAMSVVDTMMVGRVSATAIGAVSVGANLFYTVAVFGTGLMLGLDTVVSQAFGRGDLKDCHRSLLNAIYLYLPLPPLIMLLVWKLGPGLEQFGVNPEVAKQANQYLRAVAWGSFPLLLYFAFRRYLQGMNLVKPVMFSLVAANVVHIAANWLLIYGNAGFPAMGAAGAGWATCFSRLFMAVFLLCYILWHAHTHRTGLWEISFRPDWPRIQKLLALGIPAGLQISLEVGVFATATALIGRLAPETLAAHQITLNCASVTYMVPLGIGSAAAVRVGQAIGRQDQEGAKRSGWTAIFLGAFFMFCMGIVFFAFPRQVLRIYTTEPAVIQAGIPLLFFAALFQLFDGIQTVSIGALRGLGETRTPMICGLIYYWFFGLPLGYFLCFHAGWQASGLWAGLSTALILIAITLMALWTRKINAQIRPV